MKKGFKKFGNVPVTTLDGIHFDSKREAWRYQILKIKERAGEIKNLKLQVKFNFPINGVNLVYVESNRELTYIADFDYETADGERIVEDVKGVKTPDYKIKRALMMAVHGLLVKEVK